MTTLRQILRFALQKSKTNFLQKCDVKCDQHHQYNPVQLALQPFFQSQHECWLDVVIIASLWLTLGIEACVSAYPALVNRTWVNPPPVHSPHAIRTVLRYTHISWRQSPIKPTCDPCGLGLVNPPLKTEVYRTMVI